MKLIILLNHIKNHIPIQIVHLFANMISFPFSLVKCCIYSSLHYALQPNPAHILVAHSNLSCNCTQLKYYYSSLENTHNTDTKDGASSVSLGFVNPHTDEIEEKIITGIMAKTINKTKAVIFVPPSSMWHLQQHDMNIDTKRTLKNKKNRTTYFPKDPLPLGCAFIHFHRG